MLNDVNAYECKPDHTYITIFKTQAKVAFLLGLFLTHKCMHIHRHVHTHTTRGYNQMKMIFVGI